MVLFERLEESGQESQMKMSNDLETEEFVTEFEKQFPTKAMDDDLNTPKALGEFQRLRGEVNKLISAGLSET